ncbi:MAG: hypothetical protein AAGJ18_23730 [Bacteroidota bacterium]
MLFCTTLYIMWTCVSYLIWRENEINYAQLMTPYVVLVVAYLVVRKLDK